MDYDFITDRLAIGDVASRAEPGFVAVVSLLSSSPFDEQYKAPPVPKGVPVLLINIGDGRAGLEKHLTGACVFIAEHITRGCVLVHCGYGRSRSVAVVAAYLCRYAGMSLVEAVNFINERRQGACPADVFWAAITQWLHLDVRGQGGPRREQAHGR